MRFLAVLLLVALLGFSAEALKKREIQQAHAGFCPMHMMHCNVMCLRPPIHSINRTQVNNGCTTDNECGADEKCCRPACGCTNKCVKALEKPGFGKP